MFRMAKPKISWEEYERKMYEIAVSLAVVIDSKAPAKFVTKRARELGKQALKLHKQFQGI